MTRIVVGYDGSEQSHDALVLGVLLAEWIDANVILQRPSRICSRESTTRAPRRLSLPSRTPSPGPSRHREQRGRGSRRRGLDPPAPWAACFRAASVSCCSTTRPGRWRSPRGATWTGPATASHRRRRIRRNRGGAACYALRRGARPRCTSPLRVFGVVEPVQLGDVTYRPAAEEPDARFSREAMEEELDRLIETLPSEVGARRCSSRVVRRRSWSARASARWI
jgi:hypothetical protein